MIINKFFPVVKKIALDNWYQIYFIKNLISDIADFHNIFRMILRKETVLYGGKWRKKERDLTIIGEMPRDIHCHALFTK